METVRREESTEVLNTTAADTGAVYAAARSVRTSRQCEHKRRAPA